MKLKQEKLSPLGVYNEGMPWNAVEKIIMERRSVRSFRKEPLPDTMIQRILEAGRFAESAGNSQPWRFIVVKSPEVIAEMEKDAVRIVKLFMFLVDYTRGGKIRRMIVKPLAKLLSIRLIPNELHPSPFGVMSMIARGDSGVFHDAPVLVLLVTDKRGVSIPSTDIGICGQNMVLAAHSLGAGTCWIGFVKLLMYYPKWRKRFGIRYPYSLNDCIAMGWQKVHADGEVPRETQIVEWIEKGMKDPSRFTTQGE